MRLNFLVLMCLSGWTFAAPLPDLNTPAEDLPKAEAKADKMQWQPPAQNTPNKPITETELLANPALLAHTLDMAVAAGNSEAVALLLPLYRQLSAQDQDNLLILYAEAFQARIAGKVDLAIARYREMIAANPNLPPVRLQLALALLTDHQDEAAQNQFEKLQAETLPDEIRRVVEQGLNTLRQRRSWSFNVSGYYRYDNNINGAPRQKEVAMGQGKWTFSDPKKAHGIHADLSAERLLPLNNGWYAKAEAGVNADWFWDAHDYDDFRFRLGLGGGWQNARRDLGITPFVKRRIFAGKAYSLDIGMDLNASYWLTPQWRLSASGQFAHKKYDSRPWLEGNQYFTGVNALYLRNAGQYWFGGVNTLFSGARDDSDAYSRYALSAGWGKEWGKGISSRLSTTVARRIYDAPDFFNIQRKDNEYSASLSLWNRNFYFWGITPRLSFYWNKTDSNHFYYDNQNTDVYLELTRTF